MTKPFRPTEAATYEDSTKVPMSKRQRRRLQQHDTDIRNTENGDVWYTRGDTKYLMDVTGKTVTSYKIKGDAKQTKVAGAPPKSDYEILKAAGHSPLDALRVVSDANRGNQDSITRIVNARKEHG
jgi:predicted chitinase